MATEAAPSTKPASAPEKKPAAPVEKKGEAVKPLDKTAVERMEGIPEGCDFDLKTLRGDVRDALLEVFKNRPKPWSQCSEMEQRDIIAALDNAAESTVRKAARIITSAGRPSVSATLEGVHMKDGLKITAKAVFTMANVKLLADAQGAEVLIIGASSKSMMGQRRAAQVDKDQPDLIGGDDGDLANAKDKPLTAEEVGKKAAADFAIDQAAAELAKEK